MDLRLVSGFQTSEGFNERWWDHQGRHYFDNARFLAAFVDTEEVARIELDEKVDPVEYVRDSLLGNDLLEIQLIEVRGELRCSGLGTKVVAALAAKFPNRRLVAFSEDADGFWASLGWSRHLHQTDCEPNPRYRPLYMQP